MVKPIYFSILNNGIISDLQLTLNSQIQQMNFLKKMLGLEKGLQERIGAFKARGTLFQVVKQTRNLNLVDCTISFVKQDGKYHLDFSNQKGQSYQLPIHLNMSPVVFVISRGGKEQSCFEWQLQVQTQHVGCYMEPDNKNQFKDLLCLILKQLANDQHIQDHLVFCKELPGVPVYKSADKKTNTNVSSSLVNEQKVSLNEVLIRQAQKNQNKMVHTCSLYSIEQKQRKLVQQYAVFVLKAFPDFEYEFHLVNATGYTIMKKSIDSGLNYEINLDQGHIRWIDLDQDCQIVEVNFDGKRDAALSLKYNMLQVMYELREHRKLEDVVPAEQIAYIKQISNEKPLQESKNSRIVELYKDKEVIEEVGFRNVFFRDQELKTGVQYAMVCQAKIADFSIATLGSLMENLHIDEDSHIKSHHKKRLFDKESREVDIGQILLHDQDTKALLKGKDGKIYYQDLEKGKLIEQFNPSPKKGIVTICPEFKLAETTNFKTFKAISENSIYQIDPRSKDGIGNMKDYSGNPYFTSISATGDGSFATGSKNGEIRFYNQIGKNANNKFTSAGQPVIHLDTTKDGKWVLATFRKYLRLIPTENNEEHSLYSKKMPYQNRPSPIKLQISLQDLQAYGVKDFQFLPAKFDESKEGVEKFIVSGFGQYTIIWNLGLAIQNSRSYLISKTEGKVVQADFLYNNPAKLMMATSEGIVIKQNKIKK